MLFLYCPVINTREGQTPIIILISSFQMGQPTVAGNPVSAQSRLVFMPCEDGLTITFTSSQGIQRPINAQKFDTKLIN